MYTSSEGTYISLLIHRITYDEGFDSLHEGFYEGIVNFMMNVNSFDGTTALTCIVKGTIGNSGGYLSHVYIITDINWILAAEFQLGLDHLKRSRFCNSLARRK